MPTVRLLTIVALIALALACAATETMAQTIEGITATGTGAASTDPGAWPQFRGSGRDAIVPAADAAGLYRQWPAEGPNVLWTIEGLFMGYSGPSVHSGRVYFHDYDEKGEQYQPTGPRWIVRCVSLADGQEIWRWSYRRRIKPNHAVTRTVPATDGKVVVSFDPKAVLHAFDATTGKRLWGHNLPGVYRSRIPPWYNGQCPLIDEGRIIIGVGGLKVLMAAFDPATGAELWQTPNGARHTLSHSSVMPAVIGERRQYVWATLKGMVGVDATNGALLWEALWTPAGEKAAEKIRQYAADKPNVFIVDWRANTAVASSPVVMADGRIFMTSGYKAGSMMLKVSVDDAGTWSVALDYGLTYEQFNSECQTPVLVGDHLYAIDHAANKDGWLTCLSLDGKVVWQHKGDTFGLGSWIVVDDILFVLNGNTGALHMVKVTPEGYQPLGQADLLGDHDIWAPLAYVNGKLIIRDMDKMVCIEAGKPAGK